MAVEWSTYLEYQNVLNGCERTIDEIPDNQPPMTTESFKQSYQFLSTLNQSYNEGDYDGMIRYAIRLHTGVGAKKNEKEALRLYLQACKPEAPERMKGFAYSCLTIMYLNEPAKALKFANDAALNHYISPAIMRTAKSFEAVRDIPPFSNHKALWKAYDKRTKQVLKEQNKMLAREALASNKCHNPSCSVTFDKKIAQRCQGTCYAELKTCYCSKTCQKQDWPRHNIDCQRIPKDTHRTPTENERISEDVELRGNRETKPGHFSIPVNMGGNKIILQSNTMTADSLKNMAAGVETILA